MTHLIAVDDMGYVLLLPGEDGWRLPTSVDVDARHDRLVGRYSGEEVWTAPLDGVDLDGDWFDPADPPDGLSSLASAAVGDMIRGQYDVVREL